MTEEPRTDREARIAGKIVDINEAALRRRLANLPATYAFAVLQAVHQLDGVCDRIVRFAGGDKAGMEELVTLCQDIYEQTLRGMA